MFQAVYVVFGSMLYRVQNNDTTDVTLCFRPCTWCSEQCYDRRDTVFQAVYVVFGILNGPVLGVMTLGMFFPWANKWVRIPHKGLVEFKTGSTRCEIPICAAPRYSEIYPPLPLKQPQCSAD